jgi:FMN phosphatase YigB (HAD superfamily)
VTVVFIDVGGTLWPDTWPSVPADRDERIARLARLAPRLPASGRAEVVDALSTVVHPRTRRQETIPIVARTIQRLELGHAVTVDSVIDAMCLPAHGRVELYPGAAELLTGLLGQARRVIMVSNVVWRRSEAQRRDFADFGLADCIAGHVTSLDVGWRKPDARFFDAALDLGQVPARDCIMIGNSEANDIEPARSRGMRAVRVAIEHAPPAVTSADHVARSLADVASIVL